MKAPTELNVGDFGAREILQLLPDGAYICDMDRRIVFWNKAAERITGWKAEQVVGRHCRDNILVHIDKDGHPLCGREFCPLHRCMVTHCGSPSPLLVFALHHEGHRVPVEVSVSPLTGPSGEVVGGIEMFRDLTETFEDLEHASRIQRELLRLNLPADETLRIGARFSPASQVGGDFYRAERIDENRYALMVADVTGHGVSAALHCMQLRGLWEEYRGELSHPARLLTLMSRRLDVLTGGQDCYATALFVLLDSVSGEIRWANAGHPEGLVLPPGGTPRLSPTGPALALIPDFSYEEQTSTLPKGGSLLLYTDGAVEIINGKDEELGVEGLLSIAGQCLAPGGEILLSQLEDRLLRSSGGIRLADDVTLLAAFRP